MSTTLEMLIWDRNLAMADDDEQEARFVFKQIMVVSEPDAETCNKEGSEHLDYTMKCDSHEIVGRCSQCWRDVLPGEPHYAFQDGTYLCDDSDCATKFVAERYPEFKHYGK